MEDNPNSDLVKNMTIVYFHNFKSYNTGNLALFDKITGAIKKVDICRISFKNKNVFEIHFFCTENMYVNCKPGYSALCCPYDKFLSKSDSVGGTPFYIHPWC